jgi:hypothetical protein
LLKDARSKFPQAILNVYEKHVGTERTAAVQARGIQNPFDMQLGTSESRSDITGSPGLA